MIEQCEGANEMEGEMVEWVGYSVMSSCRWIGRTSHFSHSTAEVQPQEQLGLGSLYERCKSSAG